MPVCFDRGPIFVIELPTLITNIDARYYRLIYLTRRLPPDHQVKSASANEMLVLTRRFLYILRY